MSEEHENILTGTDTPKKKKSRFYSEQRTELIGCEAHTTVLTEGIKRGYKYE
jgi:hypothetical protein